MKKDTQSKIEFFLFMLVLKIFKRIPYHITETIIKKLFVFGGTILGIRKKVAKQNLRMVFPKKNSLEIHHIIRKMYLYMGITAAETYFGDFKKLYERTEISGWENLDEAVKMNKGVILTTGHLGNWELAGRYIATKHKMSVVAKKQRNQYFDEYTNKIRGKENILIIDKKNALRPILKLLKQNYIVSILMDQNAGKDGILTKFLGFDASTFVGAAKIAIKTGCPIVPAFAIRKRNGENLFISEKPIITENIEDSPENVKQLTEEISSHLEKYILKYPSQWFWVHKRWKGKDQAKKI